MLYTGKKPFVPSPNDITFAAIVEGITLPTPPSRFGHGTMFRDWQMLGNGPDSSVAPGFNGCGDCTIAGAAHETMLTNKIARKIVNFTGKEVVADYSHLSGYVIGDDSTDTGLQVRDVLSYRRHTGVLDHSGYRHKIGAYVSFSPKDFDQLMQAAYVFSAVGIGFEFPDSAMEQFNNGDTWDVVDGARIEGGHYVPVVGRPSKNLSGCVSWAQRKSFTRDFYETYNDEAWAIIYPEELKNGVSERGMDLANLEAALRALH